ncbi:MAG TPA: hypothetical protein VFU21_04755 [Kofleriaceae bacterium]|nr:hypothetical protein [Kofleriaceae bacterium]
MNARCLALALLGLGLALAATACTGSEDGGGDVLELETPELEVAAGADVTYCTYVDAEMAEDRDIIAFEGLQTELGHHTILYGVRSRQPAGTHVCTEADMINVRYLAAGGSETGSYHIQEGIAFRLRAGQQLMIQSHFINTGDRDTTGRSWFRVEHAPPDPSRQPADLFTVVTTEIEIEAHAAGHARAECPIAEDLTLIALGGHAHEWGRRVSIGRSSAAGGDALEMLYDQPWNKDRVFDPVIEQYQVDQPLRLAPGDRLRVDCEYENDTDQPLAFPAEMCVAFAFYYPAGREIDCVDGVWPGGG